MQNRRKYLKISNKIRSYNVLKKKLRMIIVNKSLHASLPILISFCNLGNVTLQEYKFNVLPKEFGILHDLEKFTLSKNLVVNTTQSVYEQLEKDYFKNSLEFLVTSNNNLFTSSLKITYSEDFTNFILKWDRIVSSPNNFDFSSLLSLDLSYNNLGKFKQSIWKWLMQAPIRNNLQELDISHNRFTTVPIEINCMKNLQILNLSENKIKFLPKEFGTLPQLIRLDLIDNLLGTSRHSTWEWLENSVRDNLVQLDIGHNFLTEFPLQITRVTNLRVLDISENKIKFLPKELGTLPHLTYLNLTNNYLGKSEYNTWEWLQQAAIKNTLSELHLCENELTELPPEIGKLHALTILHLIGNNLKHLPQTFINLKNLKELDLYGNDMLYLPASLAMLSTEIDVGENPFNLKDDNNLIVTSKMPSLMECSAEVVVKSGYKLRCATVLPKSLLRYLECGEKYCFFCETPCFFYYGKRFIKYSEYNEMMTVQLDGTSNILNASFECYACSPQCAMLLWIN